MGDKHKKSRATQAVEWIWAAEPGVVRSQSAAAKRFGIKQATVSFGMKRHVERHGGVKPDGRKRRKPVTPRP